MTLDFQDSALPEPELRDAYQIAAQHVPSFARAFNAALTALMQNATPSEAQWQAFAAVLWPMYLPVVAAAASDARDSLKKRVLKARKKEPLAIAPNERAVRWAKTQSAKLVVQVRAQTRQTIREAVASGTMRGASVRDVARELKDTLPLLPQHAQALRNFRSELQAAGEGARVIEQKINRYRETLKRYRAENVARTETVSAQAEGRLVAWQEASAAGELPSTAVRVWVAAPAASKRLCPICAELDGKEAALDGQYDSYDLGAVAHPPAHPSCRCTEILRTS